MHDHDVPLAAAELRQIDRICSRFEQALADGGAPPWEEYLAEAPSGRRPALLAELAAIALQKLQHRQRQSGGGNAADDFAAAWTALLAAQPRLAAELDVCRSRVTTLLASAAAEESFAPARHAPPQGLHVRCPHCAHPVELVADAPLDEVTCRECGSTFCLVDREDSAAPRAPLQKVGRFELLSRLGVGGFGTVWRARDPELDRIVAVKIPRRGQLREQEAELFFREARAAAQLRHPHIVPVYEIGRDGDVIYIVSALVEGDTLSQWMKAQRRTFVESAALAATIADALHFAHERGIVHRDLKPSNVMVDPQGQPQIMDFGLAKRETGEATMTVDGQILGTAAYMSPEQAAGQAHWTDRRSDVYALGVVLFQLATGELPFRGNFDAQLVSKLQDDAPQPRSLNPRVPRDLATICLKCLERSPTARYQSAAAVADDLRRFLAGEPIVARPISRLERAGRWARRRPAAALALGLGSLLAVGGPIAAVTIDRQRRDLAAKNDELYQLVDAEQADKRDLGRKIAALQADLDAVSGRNGGAGPAPSWRQALVAQIVDERLEPPAAKADENSADAVRRHLAWGMLLAEAGRPADAAARLDAARNQLQQMVEDHPRDAAWNSALADCLEQLAVARRQAGDEQLAQDAAAAALRLRTELSQREQTDAGAAVEALAAQYDAIPPAAAPADVAAELAKVPRWTKRILDAWPTEAAPLYDAACQLTGRTPAMPKKPKTR